MKASKSSTPQNSNYVDCVPQTLTKSFNTETELMDYLTNATHAQLKTMAAQAGLSPDNVREFGKLSSKKAYIDCLANLYNNQPKEESEEIMKTNSEVPEVSPNSPTYSDLPKLTQTSNFSPRPEVLDVPPTPTNSNVPVVEPSFAAGLAAVLIFAFTGLAAVVYTTAYLITRISRSLKANPRMEVPGTQPTHQLS